MNILSTNEVSDLSVSYTKQPDSNTDWYCKHVHINQINKEFVKTVQMFEWMVLVVIYI
jgi:hypothetical protein